MRRAASRTFCKFLYCRASQEGVSPSICFCTHPAKKTQLCRWKKQDFLPSSWHNRGYWFLILNLARQWWFLNDELHRKSRNCTVICHSSNSLLPRAVHRPFSRMWFYAIWPWSLRKDRSLLCRSFQRWRISAQNTKNKLHLLIVSGASKKSPRIGKLSRSWGAM